jgi:hypothetical protein
VIGSVVLEKNDDMSLNYARLVAFLVLTGNEEEGKWLMTMFYLYIHAIHV